MKVRSRLSAEMRHQGLLSHMLVLVLVTEPRGTGRGDTGSGEDTLPAGAVLTGAGATGSRGRAGPHPAGENEERETQPGPTPPVPPQEAPTSHPPRLGAAQKPVRSFPTGSSARESSPGSSPQRLGTGRFIPAEREGGEARTHLRHKRRPGTGSLKSTGETALKPLGSAAERPPPAPVGEQPALLRDASAFTPRSAQVCERAHHGTAPAAARPPGSPPRAHPPIGRARPRQDAAGNSKTKPPALSQGGRKRRLTGLLGEAQNGASRQTVPLPGDHPPSSGRGRRLPRPPQPPSRARSANTGAERAVNPPSPPAAPTKWPRHSRPRL